MKERIGLSARPMMLTIRHRVGLRTCRAVGKHGNENRAVPSASRSIRAARHLQRRLAAAILLLAFAQTAMAFNDDPAIAAICEAAAQRASQESGVPLSVLRAITLTETGRSRDGAFSPWPWTVNMEGKGVWFSTRREARAHVDHHFKRGARSFDVGCFQINYRWHGDAFASIDEMFDPLANARYAARFLGELFVEFGDWSEAAGAYHSRTPLHADRYRTRFDRIRARLGGSETAPKTLLAGAGGTARAEGGDRAEPAGTPGAAAPALNRFPLLRARSGPRSIGSLVPLGTEPTAGLRLIGGPGMAR